MRHRCKIPLGAFIAAIALSGAVTTAHARRFQTSNQRFLAIWEPSSRLTFEAAGFFSIACSVTIEGTFHSASISKVSGALVGYITSAAVARPCSEQGAAYVQNGTEEILDQGRVTTLPWHIRYDSFRGTLPRIAGVRIQLIGAGFLILREGLGSCLGLTTAVKPLLGIIEPNEATGVMEGIRADETVSIPTTTLSGLCSAVRVKGAASVLLQNSATTRIVVRLIQ